MAVMKRRKDQCIIDSGETKFVGVGEVGEVNWKGGQTRRAGCFLWCSIICIYTYIYMFLNI